MMMKELLKTVKLVKPPEPEPPRWVEVRLPGQKPFPLNMSAEEFTWTYEGQTIIFDIDGLRAAIKLGKVGALVHERAATLAPQLDGYVLLDPEYARASPNQEPLIAVQWEGRWKLIDGAHRLFRDLELGKPHIAVWTIADPSPFVIAVLSVPLDEMILGAMRSGMHPDEIFVPIPTPTKNEQPDE